MTAYPLDLTRKCDVLMKGGITSGVIYPRAVCELARNYQLRSVGGSSAGAIAAAAAAAAELDRAGGGFERLESLPDDITAKRPDGTSVLFRLFQPQRNTAGLFRTFAAGLGHSGLARWVRTAGAALLGFALWAATGAVPGAALIVLGLFGNGPAEVAAVVGGILVLVVGVVVGVSLGILRGLAKHVPANGFGLCSGMPGPASGDAAALSPWLHQTLQELAGRNDSQDPLCFGDLDHAGIQLRMMTTNLTRHQPMRMPWPEHEYYFDPDQFRRLFPDDVVEWMSREEHAPPLTGGQVKIWLGELRRAQARPLLPFPAPDHVPVVVATRMSLSFPGLISAVPLHAVDYSRSANQKAREAARKWRADYPGVAPKDALGKVAVLDYEVNWFSDGGISSNLPVHFFDAPLPTRPTFAVDLAPFPPDHPKSTSEAENSYLPAVNQGGVNRRWSRWGTSGLGSVGAFAHSIVDTARSWVDQAQLAMPGYRDRIVTIYHDHSEGGMNLTMDKDVVDHLADRGVAGATKLVDSFVHGDGWDNHRWIRFRTATAGLDGWLAGFDHGYTFATSDGTPYSLLAGPGAKAPLPSYKVEGDQRLTINLRTGALLTLAANWQTKPSGAFTTGSPTPRPVLRLVPGQILAEALDPAAASLKAPDPLQPGADTSTLDVPAD